MAALLRTGFRPESARMSAAHRTTAVRGCKAAFARCERSGKTTERYGRRKLQRLDKRLEQTVRFRGRQAKQNGKLDPGVFGHPRLNRLRGLDVLLNINEASRRQK